MQLLNKAVPYEYIEKYSNALNKVSDESKARLIAALAAIDYGAAIKDIRNAVIAIMETVCEASSLTAARLAAEFFDGLRAYMVGEKLGAIVYTGREKDGVSEAVRAFMQLLVDDEAINEFTKRCVERLDYETRRAANMCMYENAQRDPLKPKYARIPTGDETCAFCLILASRGFDYNSATLAEHSHDNCDCRVIPSWSESPEVDGGEYDLQRYKDVYQSADDLRNSDDMPEELRKRVERAKAIHDKRFEQGKTKRKWTNINELTIIARWLNPALH